jgi:hypothetical protein
LSELLPSLSLCLILLRDARLVTPQELFGDGLPLFELLVAQTGLQFDLRSATPGECGF